MIIILYNKIYNIPDTFNDNNLTNNIIIIISIIYIKNIKNNRPNDIIMMIQFGNDAANQNTDTGLERVYTLVVNKSLFGATYTGSRVE